jgi:HSP20 family protein
MFTYRYNVRPVRVPEHLDRMVQAFAVPPQRANHGVRTLPVDVWAADDAFVITAAVPGLRAEDLKLEVLADTVTVSGEIASPEAGEAGEWLLRERRYGKFARTVTLPSEVESGQAEAAIENGLLTIRLPKAETARPKNIKVVAR